MMQEKTGKKPKLQTTAPQTEEDRERRKDTARQSGLFSADIVEQLNAVFAKMERRLQLRLSLDNRPVSGELKAYMEEMAAMTEKLSVEILEDPQEQERPCVRVFLADGTDTGLAFHGVPGGHEFTSFVLGLYNASGPGLALDEKIMREIAEIGQKTQMQIMVSLSCTMCPELVTAAQRIAVANEKVSVEVYDLNHFPERKEKYQVMSVPCLVINDGMPIFGKKNIEQLLSLIEDQTED